MKNFKKMKTKKKKNLSYVDKMTILLTIIALLFAIFTVLIVNGNISIGESGFFINF